MGDKTPEREGPAWIEGKDRRLDVLSAAPLVLSTPSGLLGNQPTTDKYVLYVRNIQDLPQGMTMQPLPLEGWQIELVGLIEPSRLAIRAEDLVGMDQVECEMVLQCSGNGRTRYEGVPGTPWGQGGVANVRFTGVPLSSVLERHNVRVKPQVKYVTAEGHELPREMGKPDLEHSLPLADVLEKSILALRLNGEDLPGIHGGPVRLVTPGFFGTMQVKWLTRLRFEIAESSSHYHATEYRVPLSPVKQGETFTFNLDNSRPTWFLRLVSYILDPLPGSKLKAGPVTVRGVAFNDGAAPLDSVLVSFDRGRRWQAAELQVPESPYAWYPWAIETALQPGAHEIWARAIDALGRSQPLDGAINWNPNGYEWTGVHKLEVTAT